MNARALSLVIVASGLVSSMAFADSAAPASTQNGKAVTATEQTVRSTELKAKDQSTGAGSSAMSGGKAVDTKAADKMHVTKKHVAKVTSTSQTTKTTVTKSDEGKSPEQAQGQAAKTVTPKTN